MHQLGYRGMFDAPLLDAMSRVPRERFVAPSLRHLAYADLALSIGSGRETPRPWHVAQTVAALDLNAGSRVLEVGTGTGYTAAVLAQIALEVFTLESDPKLASAAASNFEALGIENVTLGTGDGLDGWPDRMTFDAIAVTAVVAEPPRQLFGQLAPDGCLVAPIRNSDATTLTCFRRAEGGETSEESLARLDGYPHAPERRARTAPSNAS